MAERLGRAGAVVHGAAVEPWIDEGVEPHLGQHAGALGGGMEAAPFLAHVAMDWVF